MSEEVTSQPNSRTAPANEEELMARLASSEIDRIIEQQADDGLEVPPLESALEVQPGQEDLAALAEDLDDDMPVGPLFDEEAMDAEVLAASPESLHATPADRASQPPVDQAQPALAAASPIKPQASQDETLSTDELNALLDNLTSPEPATVGPANDRSAESAAGSSKPATEEEDLPVMSLADLDQLLARRAGEVEVSDLPAAAEPARPIDTSVQEPLPVQESNADIAAIAAISDQPAPQAVEEHAEPLELAPVAAPQPAGIQALLWLVNAINQPFEALPLGLRNILGVTGLLLLLPGLTLLVLSWLKSMAG